MTLGLQRAAMLVALLTSSACTGNEATNEAVNNAQEREPFVNSSADATGAKSNGSAEVTNAATAARPNQSTAHESILAWSKPASGSTVTAPVNELIFHFSPPARLGEVTVTGAQGAMPMMVTAVGEGEHYSLPLPGLDAGRYTVNWKASARGVDYKGSFGFEVR
jgi:methionine-rich copper-binding protein CopC